MRPSPVVVHRVSFSRQRHWPAALLAALISCGGPAPGSVRRSSLPPEGRLGALIGGGFQSLCHLGYSGPKKGLAVVAVIAQPDGTEVERIVPGSFPDAVRTGTLDADVWVEVCELPKPAQPHRLCVVRIAAQGNLMVERFFLDQLLPDAVDGHALGGSGASAAPDADIPDSRLMVLFEGSFSYGNRPRRLQVGLELR